MLGIFTTHPFSPKPPERMPTTSTPTTAVIVQAYRHLYRGLLRGVHYSKPARFTARDKLRSAFRTKSVTDFNQERISRTLEFLRGAEKEAGIEHKVLKNLLIIAFWRTFDAKRETSAQQHKKNEPAHSQVIASAYRHYDETIAMLNESMDLCLR